MQPCRADASSLILSVLIGPPHLCLVPIRLLQMRRERVKSELAAERRLRCVLLPPMQAGALSLPPTAVSPASLS